MRVLGSVVAAVLLVCPLAGVAQQDGPYKVLQTARTGGEGGWDYIYADAAARRLYIPRGASEAVAAKGGVSATAAVAERLTMFNLDTLAPEGEIAGIGGQGTAVDPRSHHGFTSDHPQVSMFDTKTDKLLKHIDVGAARADGIYFDPATEHVYVFSHPTKDATVIDAKDGSVVGTIALGGTPEEGVIDSKGTLYAVMQDGIGSVTVVDGKTMKVTGHYSFGDRGSCNGLALDEKNRILFAACRTGSAPGQEPSMVILNAKDGAILAKLPLAGGSDGAVFNPETMEAFSSQGNGTMTIVKEESPTKFVVEQNLRTMDGARTVTLDTKTGHLFTMSQEREPVPAGAVGEGGRPARGAAVPGSFTILMVGREK